MNFKFLTLLVLIGLAVSQDSNETLVSKCSANGTERNYFASNNLTLNVVNLTLADLPAPYATVSSAFFANPIAVPNNASLNVPEGFHVNVYAKNLNQSRWLALTPDGNVLVTQTYVPNILLMKDTDGDGVADQITEFANADNGLDMPFGMDFSDGWFYLGNGDGIYRFNYTVGQEQLEGTGEKIVDLPVGGNHWTRGVRVTPDKQNLLITCGSASNVDIEEAPRATVQISNLDGSNLTILVSGIRNPNGLDFHPITNEPYTVVNERDELGDDLVPDYFTRLQQGEFYGWPYTYLSPDNIDPRHADNSSNNTNGTLISVEPELAASTVTPDVLFQAHSAALGMRFYNGTQFPVEYQNGAFVAFHGSWNRDSATGYKIVFVPFDETNRPIGDYEDFVTGFVLDPVEYIVWGRPVGVLVLPDGSLIFTDDGNGWIYRVSYNPALVCNNEFTDDTDLTDNDGVVTDVDDD